MARPSFSIASLMAIVAADLAFLVAGGLMIPNPGLMVMAVILEVGLFRIATRRASSRAFWVGFEVSGWSYLLIHAARALPIWRWTRAVYESRVLGHPIADSRESLRFLLAAAAFQLGLVLPFAILAGLASRAVVRRRLGARPGRAAPGGA